MLSSRCTTCMLRTLVFMLLLLTAPLCSQQPSAEPPQQSAMPRDYRGPSMHVDGIFVTPVPNASFTATVEIVSHNKLPDGTEHIVKTENTIARASSGRIRNERRQMVPQGFTGKPRLLSAHIYDPNTRENIYTDPRMRLARQFILPQPPRIPGAQLPPDQQRKQSGVTETQLGNQELDGVQLTGIRKTRIVPATVSGTGQPLTITDDYWYSPELSIYLIIRHDDPRTGEQIVAVTHIERGEPEAGLLLVPDGYKRVDETPPAKNGYPDFE
jgi:hypothetical protein